MIKFWKRESGGAESADAIPDPSADTPSGAGAPSALEKIALDQLAALLRLWAQYAFDLDEIKASSLSEQLERWSRHVLNATPVDGTQPTRAPDDSPENRRDWSGLRDFTARIRRSEQSYVNRQVTGARQAMSEFVETLGHILADDQQEQARVLEIIGHLRELIESNAPFELLTREVTQAIDKIGDIARERTNRNKALLADLTDKLQSMRGELEEAQREMELDPLTRLFNRKAFDIQLEHVFELCKLSGQPASLMMLDVDLFKRVNDEYGHPVGDLVLQRIANCCAQSFPRKTDFVARYGGEELGIVLQDTDLATARQLSERLLESIRSLSIKHEGGSVSVTASIGMADLKPHASAGQWLNAADTALYQAKEAGRDRVCAFKRPAGKRS